MKIVLKIILLRTVVVLITCALMLPSAVKLTHAFNHHQHEVCEDDESKLHFHTLDLECDFYKYKLTGEAFVCSELNDDFNEFFEIIRTESLQSSHKGNSLILFNLRAPPINS